MPTIEQQIIDLDAINRFNTAFTKFIKFEKSLTKTDKKTLKRSHVILSKFDEKFKFVDFNQTPIRVFQTVAGHTDSINSFIETFNLPTTTEQDKTQMLENIDSTVNQFLEVISLINCAENGTEILGQANSTLADTKTNANAIQKLKEKAEQVVEETEAYKAKNESIAQILATKVLVGDFHERSVNEGKEAKFWTRATSITAISTIVVVIAFSIWQFKNFSESRELDIQLLSSKILIATALGLIAKWTSKRANRHLLEESKYHRLAVNNSTIKEFIATLPDEQKHTVISAVALKIFTEGTGNESSTEFESLNIIDLIKGIMPNTDK